MSGFNKLSLTKAAEFKEQVFMGGKAVINRIKDAAAKAWANPMVKKVVAGLGIAAGVYAALKYGSKIPDSATLHELGKNILQTTGGVAGTLGGIFFASMQSDGYKKEQMFDMAMQAERLGVSRG